MALRNLTCLLLFGWTLVCCQPSQTAESPFDKGKSVGTNKNKKLEEASGLVASVRNPGYLWTHNDGGNPPRLFLLSDTSAKTKKVFSLAYVANRDWEDITLGPGPVDSIRYLYVGDIGDNLAQYPLKLIYRLKEPALDAPELITDFDTLIVKLPDEIRDSETLMSDPVSKNLYLVSKREKHVRVYEIHYPFVGDTLVPTIVCKVPLEDANGGSISADGSEVLLRNYHQIFYWKKKGNETIGELLSTPAIELDYDPEPQGESIAWALNGSGFFTLSENAKGERAKLYFYRRK